MYQNQEEENGKLIINNDETWWALNSFWTLIKDNHKLSTELSNKFENERKTKSLNGNFLANRWKNYEEFLMLPQLIMRN